MAVEMTGVIFQPLVAGMSLGGVNDVTITNVVDGQILIYNGVEWVNANVPGTNLSQVSSSVDVFVQSSTGSGTTLTAANGTDAGIMTSADWHYLYNIEAGATHNESDAYLLNRSNQTGTQLASTISDLTTATRTIIGTSLIAGPNITITYESISGTTTISSTASTVGTNLSQGPSTATTIDVHSSTGTAATLTAATTVVAGVMSSADKIKLDSLTPGVATLTATEIAFGDITDSITSSPALVFNDATDTLQVGATGGIAVIEGDAGLILQTVTGNVSILPESSGSVIMGEVNTPGLIESGAGQALTIQGDTGLSLVATSGRVSVTTGAATYDLPATDGTSGQVIVTDGNGDLSFASALFTTQDTEDRIAALEQLVQDQAVLIQQLMTNAGL